MDVVPVIKELSFSELENINLQLKNIHDNFSSIIKWINVETNVNRSIESITGDKFQFIWRLFQKTFVMHDAETKLCEDTLKPLALNFEHFSNIWCPHQFSEMQEAFSALRNDCVVEHTKTYKILTQFEKDIHQSDGSGRLDELEIFHINTCENDLVIKVKMELINTQMLKFKEDQIKLGCKINSLDHQFSFYSNKAFEAVKDTQKLETIFENKIKQIVRDTFSI